MKQKLASFTVLIEKEKRTGTNEVCYSAVVPILGIATDADTLEQVKKDVQKLIEFQLESLAEEREIIPTETKNIFVTKFEALLPKNALLAR